MERCCFNCFSEQFHVRDDLRHGPSWKQDRKFLSAHAVRLPAAAYASKSGRDHAEHLVAGFVPIGIVEAFEMVDIYRRDGIRFFQAKQRIVEGAPGTQPSKLVVISQQVGILNDRANQDEAGGSHISSGSSYSSPLFKRQKCRCKRPEQSAFDGLSIEEKTRKQNTERRQQGKNRQLRQRRPTMSSQ